MCRCANVQMSERADDLFRGIKNLYYRLQIDDSLNNIFAL